MLKLAVLAMLAGSHWIMPDWPPPGAGNDTLKGTITTPQSDWNQEQQQKWDDAMDLVGNLAPGTAAEINAQCSNGSVNLVEIENPENPDPGTELSGRSDGNTLGVEMDGRNPADVAGSIIHEWGHVNGQATDPNYEEGPCAEAEGSAAQMTALATLSCEAEPPPTCGELETVTSDFLYEAAMCAASGGTPPSPPAPSSCGC